RQLRPRRAGPSRPPQAASKPRRCRPPSLVLPSPITPSLPQGGPVPPSTALDERKGVRRDLAADKPLDKAARLWSKARMADVKLHPDWLARIGGEFDQPYMVALKEFLAGERAKGKTIYPRPSHWFAALDATPPQDVRVVILGQDPYHGPGQAHGLCFSVQPGVRVPPSLVNIYKELKADLGIQPARHGYLGHWAEQGVLLLNNCL